MAIIETAGALEALIGAPSEMVRLKIHRSLNASARGFIARSPMALLATCGADGMPTVSPKGDHPGFVQVEDEHTLLIPERKGNKLVFSFHNLLHNPKVGLIFLVPGTGETLRVHGRAELRDDEALRARFATRGRPALLVMKLSVDSCYFHCAKAFLRAELWDPARWPAPLEISFGAEIAERGGLSGDAIGAFDEAVHSRYKSDL